MELFYATGNRGKFEEVFRYLADLNSSITLVQAPVPIIEIQSLDQKAVALDKARQAFDQLKKPFIIDDAALYFPKYNQFPGVFTRYVYEGIGVDGIFRLVEPGDRAYFLLYLVYGDAQGNFQTFEGRCEGRVTRPNILKAPKDLPFDDFFIPDGSDLSYVDMAGTPMFVDYAYRLKAVKKLLEVI